MSQHARNVVRTRVSLLLIALWACAFGCEAFSHRMTSWQMLGQEALDDPIRAVGGDGIVFSPPGEDRTLSRDQVAKALPAELVAYYAPVLIQQRVDTAALSYPYPKEYDQIGEARLQRDAKGELKSSVAGPATVYAIFQKVKIDGRERVQLTYTAWYPAHPRMKTIDLESANIDSCVLRVTLDGQNSPVLYETIAACGCFHKVFVAKWVEEAAAQQYGPPEKGKKLSIERTVKEDIDWDVVGVVDEKREQPRRPVVFLKAGDHKVIGMGSTSRLKVQYGADARTYTLADYADLYSVAITGTKERGAFFDMDNGGKVRGAERKERFIFSVIGVDDAGQPRANDQIKLHFDQSTWGDPTIYTRYMRLPAGVP
jgi:hypothetical protein